MVLLHLKAKELRNGKTNPKNYPYSDKLKELIDDEIVEIDGIVPLDDIKKLVDKADNIICVDSFLQHLAWSMGKKAIVLWGQGNPRVFGHVENINLIKDNKYIRKNQFDTWENERCVNESFVYPEEVIKCLR